jgi:hypothetical protein
MVCADGVCVGSVEIDSGVPPPIDLDAGIVPIIDLDVAVIPYDLGAATSCVGCIDIGGNASPP